jgi:single-stranded DNA-binding protein
MNYISLTSRIIPNTVNFNKWFNYYPGNENKKSVLIFTVPVKSPMGEKDEKGYYKTKNITCKAFGHTADFINKYVGGGANVVIEGKLAWDEGTEKPDGTKYEDRWYLLVTNCEAPLNDKKKVDEDEATAAPASTPKATKESFDIFNIQV